MWDYIEYVVFTLRKALNSALWEGCTRAYRIDYLFPAHHFCTFLFSSRCPLIGLINVMEDIFVGRSGDHRVYHDIFTGFSVMLVSFTALLVLGNVILLIYKMVELLIQSVQMPWQIYTAWLRGITPHVDATAPVRIQFRHPHSRRRPIICVQND